MLASSTLAAAAAHGSITCPSPILPAMKEKREKKEAQREADDDTPKVLITEPAEVDVLCGRGGMSNHHPGNEWYRRLIRSNRPLYRACPKHTKLLVSKAIVQAVQKQGGRFLEKDKKSGQFYVVQYKRAVDKTSQGLRERDRDEDDPVKEKQGNSPGEVPEQFSGRVEASLQDLADVAIAQAQSAGLPRSASDLPKRQVPEITTVPAPQPKKEKTGQQPGRAGPPVQPHVPPPQHPYYRQSGLGFPYGPGYPGHDFSGAPFPLGVPPPPAVQARNSSMFRLLRQPELLAGESTWADAAQPYSKIMSTERNAWKTHTVKESSAESNGAAKTVPILPKGDATAGTPNANNIPYPGQTYQPPPQGPGGNAQPPPLTRLATQMSWLVGAFWPVDPNGNPQPHMGHHPPPNASQQQGHPHPVSHLTSAPYPYPPYHAGASMSGGARDLPIAPRPPPAPPGPANNLPEKKDDGPIVTIPQAPHNVKITIPPPLPALEARMSTRARRKKKNPSPTSGNKRRASSGSLSSEPSSDPPPNKRKKHKAFPALPFASVPSLDANTSDSSQTSRIREDDLGVPTDLEKSVSTTLLSLATAPSRLMAGLTSFLGKGTEEPDLSRMETEAAAAIPPPPPARVAAGKVSKDSLLDDHEETPDEARLRKVPSGYVIPGGSSY